ncbi:MAG: GPW/gp25 family protein [Verrucomicrobiota bacterium]|nr:GPW/gp25 family protein [Verrucomicrobiota bacterium]
MNGINAATGKRLSGYDHLAQSIRDILMTPIGSRVMRRDYGSRLHKLIGQGITAGNMIDVYAATAEALRKWEPRFQSSRFFAVMPTPGQLEIDIYGIYKHTGEEIVMKGIQIAA